MDFSTSEDENGEEFHFWTSSKTIPLLPINEFSNSNESITDTRRFENIGEFESPLEILRHFKRNFQVQNASLIRQRGGASQCDFSDSSFDPSASFNATYVNPPPNAICEQPTPNSCPMPKKYNIKFSGSATVLSRTENADANLQRSQSIASIQNCDERVPNQNRLTPFNASCAPPQWLEVPGNNMQLRPRQLNKDLSDYRLEVPQNVDFERRQSAPKTPPKVCRKNWGAPSKRVADNAPEFVPWWNKPTNKDNILKMELGYNDKSWNECNRSSYDSDYDVNQTNLDRSGYAADLSNSFNPHATLISTPFKRFGRNPVVYNRKNPSFERDMQDVSSVYLEPPIIGQPCPEACDFSDSSYDPNASFNATYVEPPPPGYNENISFNANHVGPPPECEDLSNEDESYDSPVPFVPLNAAPAACAPKINPNMMKWFTGGK